MHFLLPSIKCSAGPPSLRLLPNSVHCLNSAQRFHYRMLGSSRKLGGAGEHLIDGSEKRICWLSFEFQSPHVIERCSNTGGGRLREFRPCLIKIWNKLEHGNCRDLPHAPMLMQCYVHVKSQFWAKKTGSSIEKFLSLVLPGNTTMVTAPYYPIFSLLSVSGRLLEVKNKRKFQTFSSKSGHVCLREVVAYKRFAIQ